MGVYQCTSVYKQNTENPSRLQCFLLVVLASSYSFESSLVEYRCPWFFMGWSTVFEVFRNCYELPIQVFGLIMSPTSWAKGQRSAWCIEPHRGSILCGECSATVSAGVSFATWYPHVWCISSIFQHILKHHIPHQEASDIFLWAWLLSYVWLWVQAAFSAFWIPNTWKKHQIEHLTKSLCSDHDKL